MRSTTEIEEAIEIVSDAGKDNTALHCEDPECVVCKMTNAGRQQYAKIITEVLQWAKGEDSRFGEFIAAVKAGPPKPASEDEFFAA